MKKFMIFAVIMAMMLSLCACGKVTASVTSEIVDAVITKASSTTLTVEYCDAVYTIRDSDLYDQYCNNIGSIVKMVLITRTYENGDIEKFLVFNQTVFNGGGLK